MSKKYVMIEIRDRGCGTVFEETKIYDTYEEAEKYVNAKIDVYLANYDIFKDEKMVNVDDDEELSGSWPEPGRYSREDMWFCKDFIDGYAAWQITEVE